MANGKTMQAVVNLAGSIDPSLGKAIEQAQKKISGLNVKALAVGAAVGGIAVATGKAVVEAGKYMKDLGASFDDAADAIRIGTGATGDALDGLLDDFDAVYKSVPTTMEDASKAIADYNTRLGLSYDNSESDTTADQLRHRAEAYPLRVLPDAALVATPAVDWGAAGVLPPTSKKV